MARVQLPAAFVESARAFTTGEKQPVEPRNAATVVLLRPGSAGGSEVYLLRRQTSMAFAGGMCVFPGGGVDPRDFDDHGVRWAGPDAATWARRLGTDEATARALVCAAVRETFEESGVLLAGESAETVVADVTGEDWERDRAALEGRELAFTDFLERRGLVLRTDLLAPFRAWLTPEFEPRRYRTWFFAAVLPEGQRTRDVSTESDAVAWLPALDAVAQVDAEQILMLPPTWMSCLEVGQHAGPADVLAAGSDRTVEMFVPELVEDPDDPEGATLTTPPWMQELLEGRP
ncbi:hypothetical protein ASG49_12880 [Marmoricola sp. Leaf446]|uniref:NUDIX hydrolase n=1 Tax=Marmoricola sp. Leaf446 TaxID=1736379 RepID=UPI0006FAEC54|nr:NUDIX domain-containing protein [Marmoricola sp. Leaf446]KQT90657.1 hypothetical protein ASG49_12880 [Marmoricola sp. Leaf446]